MARGRPKHLDPPIKWFVNLPTTLAAEVELLLLDPVTGQPKYGERSQLIEQLLREWVDRQRLTRGPTSDIKEDQNYDRHHSNPNTTGDSTPADVAGTAGGPPPTRSGEGTG